jgi:hypothetical protein
MQRLSHKSRFLQAVMLKWQTQLAAMLKCQRAPNNRGVMVKRRLVEHQWPLEQYLGLDR